MTERSPEMTPVISSERVLAAMNVYLDALVQSQPHLTHSVSYKNMEAALAAAEVCGG